MNKTKIPCSMTIAGSDSGAGAGIQADLLTFASHGVYGTTAISAITAQNPNMVSTVSAPDSDILAKQMNAIADFYEIKSAKTGMLFDAKLIKVVADFFKSHKEIKLVLDPVMISTSGAKLLKDDAIEMLETTLIPLAEVITPNLDEGAVLLNVAKIVDVEESAKALAKKYAVNVLLKGGHLESDDIFDVLATPQGDINILKSKRIPNINTHGSGCTLSASIASNLAKGFSLLQSCKYAQEYIVATMKNPLETAGEKFINHFPNKWVRH